MRFSFTVHTYSLYACTVLYTRRLIISDGLEVRLKVIKNRNFHWVRRSKMFFIFERLDFVFILFFLDTTYESAGTTWRVTVNIPRLTDLSTAFGQEQHFTVLTSYRINQSVGAPRHVRIVPYCIARCSVYWHTFALHVHVQYVLVVALSKNEKKKKSVARNCPSLKAQLTHAHIPKIKNVSLFRDAFVLRYLPLYVNFLHFHSTENMSPTSVFVPRSTDTRNTNEIPFRRASRICVRCAGESALHNSLHYGAHKKKKKRNNRALTKNTILLM